jgi:hypothetical protein
MASGNYHLEITAILPEIYGNKWFLTVRNDLICLTKIINVVLIKTWQLPHQNFALPFFGNFIAIHFFFVRIAVILNFLPCINFIAALQLQ